MAETGTAGTVLGEEDVVNISLDMECNPEFGQWHDSDEEDDEEEPAMSVDPNVVLPPCHEVHFPHWRSNWIILSHLHQYCFMWMMLRWPLSPCPMWLSNPHLHYQQWRWRWVQYPTLHHSTWRSQWQFWTPPSHALVLAFHHVWVTLCNSILRERELLLCQSSFLFPLLDPPPLVLGMLIWSWLQWSQQDGVRQLCILGWRQASLLLLCPLLWLCLCHQLLHPLCLELSDPLLCLLQYVWPSISSRVNSGSRNWTPLPFLLVLQG